VKCIVKCCCVCNCVTVRVQAEFVVFVVSDGFCQDVQSSRTSSGRRCTLSRYVNALMRREYVDSCCRHLRSVPILLPHTNCASLPLWLRDSHLYKWQEDYRKLFHLFYDRIKELRRSVS